MLVAELLDTRPRGWVGAQGGEEVSARLNRRLRVVGLRGHAVVKPQVMLQTCDTALLRVWGCAAHNARRVANRRRGAAARTRLQRHTIRGGQGAFHSTSLVLRQRTVIACDCCDEHGSATSGAAGIATHADRQPAAGCGSGGNSRCLAATSGGGHAWRVHCLFQAVDPVPHCATGPCAVARRSSHSRNVPVDASEHGFGRGGAVASHERP